MKISNMGVEIM